MRQIQALARDLSRVVPDGPFKILIGGSPGYYNDFSDYMWKSFPRVFGFVILTTLALLFAAFRSFILPLKAVLANLARDRSGLRGGDGDISVRLAAWNGRTGATVRVDTASKCR